MECLQQQQTHFSFQLESFVSLRVFIFPDIFTHETISLSSQGSTNMFGPSCPDVI